MRCLFQSLRVRVRRYEKEAAVGLGSRAVELALEDKIGEFLSRGEENGDEFHCVEITRSGATVC